MLRVLFLVLVLSSSSNLTFFPPTTKANFGGNLQATDYMIKPVQRICKYPLLMREVARNLPEGHRVQVQVIMSLSGIEAIAGTVNSAGESSEPVISHSR